MTLSSADVEAGVADDGAVGRKKRGPRAGGPKRRSFTPKLVLRVKAFLKAGILTEDSGLKESRAGAPQGGILSPVISNIALSVLDEAIAAGSNCQDLWIGRCRGYS
ncbi:hypothetical protein [Streptomyces lunaelactis]|uniref:hypothetical protein n=1 Tax=Streptomyces lunaelactis TaxID=1535768 RepID=UPI001C306A2B